MVDFFIQHQKNLKRLSAHTILAYEADINQFKEFIDPDKLSEATFQDIRAWISTLSENKISNQSINRKISSLKKFYKFLYDSKKIANNPASVIKTLRTPSRISAFLKENQIFELLDNHSYVEGFPGVRDKLMIELFYGTGVRLSELINLKISDADLVSGRIKVLGKGSKYRFVPLYQRLVELINEYLSIRNNVIAEENDSLLLTDKYQPLYPMFVQRKVKGFIAEVSTLQKNSPHVLRHTFATHLLNKGADLMAIKELLGHTSLAATQVYTHNSISKLKKVFEKAHPKA